MADNLKIKVSGSDVNREYETIENRIKDKDQFQRMLQAQGIYKSFFQKRDRKIFKKNESFRNFC